MTIKNILITGATGFIGKHLAVTLLKETPHQLRLSSRSELDFSSHPNVCVLPLIHMGPETNWSDALIGCDVVIHTAARVHMMKENADDALHEFRRVNVEGTLTLARQAAQQGVKRFIFLSSIGVNGARTVNEQSFSADDIPHPENNYARSKWEAEQGLQRIAAETAMDVVIIRPPLVYGPHAKGNFQRLISWVNRGIPLPLGAVHNQRSFVAIDNLISLIQCCIHHPGAANQLFLVSDDEDVSTSMLLKKVGKALKKPVYLLPIPTVLLNIAASLLGKKTDVGRLCDSLKIDINKTRTVLGWKPQIRMDEALSSIISTCTIIGTKQK